MIGRHAERQRLATIANQLARLIHSPDNGDARGMQLRLGNYVGNTSRRVIHFEQLSHFDAIGVG